MIKTGEYIITYYNSYGAKLKDLKDLAESYTTALETGKRRLMYIPQTQEDRHIIPASFTIDRRLHNTLDRL